MQTIYKRKKLAFELKIEDRNLLKTFLRWVRTSANFFEVPILIIEPKVSIIPSIWNNSVSDAFLTAESYNIRLSADKITHIFWAILIRKKVYLHSKN